jgi:hypothetical protein
MAGRLARFARGVILLDVIAISAVVALGLIGGLRSPREFGPPLMIGDVMVIALSAGSIMGDDAATHSPGYRYAQSVTAPGMQQPVERSPGRRLVDFAEFFQYVLAGGIVLALGLFLSG